MESSHLEAMAEEVEQVIDPNNLLDDMQDSSMFYSAADFPPLPDFPCMSASSSSSSTRAPVKPTSSTTTSSSSASSSSSSSLSSSSSASSSWAVLRSDQETDHHSPQPPPPPPLSTVLSSTASMEIVNCGQGGGQEDVVNCGGAGGGDDCCLDVMETFGYMDLLECNDLFDPASIFQSNENTINNSSMEEYQIHDHEEQKLFQQGADVESHCQLPEAAGAIQPPHEHYHPGPTTIRAVADEMGEVFLEWLRTNKDNISAEDLRKIKIKKATIESAARRLGGGKAAMKQLLKLILEWVQSNHLYRKRKEAEAANHNNQFQYHYQETTTDPPSFLHSPNPNNSLFGACTFSPEPTSCFTQPQWVAPPPPHFDQSNSIMAAPASAYSPMVGYMGAVDPLSNSNSSGELYPPSEFHMFDSNPTWPLPHLAAAAHYNYIPDSNMQPSFGGYGYVDYSQQQFYNCNPGSGQGPLMRFGSSATKEARKKRMARQRRLLTHHRGGGVHHGHLGGSAANHQVTPQNTQPVADQQHARLGGCDPAPPNWMYWPTPAAAQPHRLPPEPITQGQNMAMDRAQATAMQAQHCQRQAPPDRRQGWKPENNLKFLLQKVLKQSDVGNLGRIVLPKKEAETHLPELEARDGISIAMEDIGTSRVWNMRYRFWPNNKSRMYLLENTGDFVRTNGLQEGDFIVIYSDVKSGKYLIRGVKVRQSEGTKLEAKRQENSQKNLQGGTTGAGNGSSHISLKKAV